MTNFDQAGAAIKIAIQLGIDVESADRGLEPIVNSITPAQVDWLSDWLAGEGFERADIGVAAKVIEAQAQAATYRHAIAEALETLPGHRPEGEVGADVHKAAQILREALSEGSEA